MAENFSYFLARRGPRPPFWISPIQWVLVAAYFAAAYWITFGRGMVLLSATLQTYHGIFADEVVWRVGIFPNLALSALAVLSLLLWLQIVWDRCRVGVAAKGDGWEWTGREGPKQPRLVARTPGGAWVLGEGRWWYIPRGLVNGAGQDWISASGAPSVSLLNWRRFASPLAGCLVLLLASAWAVQTPIRHDQNLRVEIARDFRQGHTADAEALARRHPEFRPWLRYMQTLPGCSEARCLHEQIVARLEGVCIGPFFGGDGAILLRLLALNGWHELALKLMGANTPAARETLIRLDLPDKVRALPRSARDPNDLAKGGMEATLLLEEGRFEEAYLRVPVEPDGGITQRGAILRGVLASLTGRCREAKKMARLLMAPDSLAQPRLEGDAPPTGLGALQRAARPVRNRASYAAALLLLDHVPEAGAKWREAERLAELAGIPGLLDLDRVLLRRLAPEGPWSLPPPPHRRPGSTP